MSLKGTTIQDQSGGTGDVDKFKDQTSITTAQAQKSPGNADSIPTLRSTDQVGTDGEGIFGGAETRTVTRTTNLVGDNDGALRTVTRLSTQTGIIDVDASSSSEGSSSMSPTSSTATMSSLSVDAALPNVTQTSNATSQSLSSSSSMSPSRSSGSLSTSINTPTGAVATSPPENGNVNQITTFTDPSEGASKTMGQMMQMDTSLVTMSTATNNRAAASTSSPAPENIFVPGHKLFPLGVTVIILGGLFVLITIGIILVRVLGWNSKRRLRLFIGSFMDVDPHSRFSPNNTMYEPKFETITTNNHHIASTNPNPNPFEPSTPEGSSARLVEGGYAGIGSRLYTNNPVETFNYPDRQRYNLNDPPVNPFEPAQAIRGTSKLDVPMDVGMGSPVPSFNTGRMAYTYPNPSAYTTNPDPTSSASSFVVGRNLVGQARSDPSKGSMSPVALGTSPATGLGYLAAQRGERRSNGSFGSSGGGSTYSTSSGGSDHIMWTTNGRPAYTAQQGAPGTRGLP